MSSFPNRLARSSFGPKLKDRFPIVDEEHEIGERALNLDFWVTAGMNLTCARALLSVTASSGGATTDYQGLAWDPDGQLPKLTWTRDAQGVFSFAFPSATYKDERGNDVTLNILGGQVIPQALSGSNPVTGHFVKTGPRAGTCHLYVPNTNAKADINFIMMLF